MEFFIKEFSIKEFFIKRRHRIPLWILSRLWIMINVEGDLYKQNYRRDN